MPLSNAGDKSSRTPSPLKEIPEVDEISTDIPARALDKIPEKHAPQVHFPGYIDPLAKSVKAPIMAPSSPPPQTSRPQGSQPLSPRPAKKVTLPSIPPIKIPPLVGQVDRTQSPSPDLEKKDLEEELDTVAPEKRTTVFLQEAGKRKESTPLPPLPISPSYPLPLPPAPKEPSLPMDPPDPAVDRPVSGRDLPPLPGESLSAVHSETPAPAQDEPPVQIRDDRFSWAPDTPTPMKAPHKQVDDYEDMNHVEPQESNPSIPTPSAPSAPVVENKLLESQGGSNSHEMQDLYTQESGRTTHRMNHAHTPQHSVSSKVSSHTPFTPVAEPRIGSLEGPSGHDEGSPVHQLPELEIPRPITWGPLSFGGLGGEPIPQVPQSYTLPEADEESDWEKVEKHEAQEDVPTVDVRNRLVEKLQPDLAGVGRSLESRKTGEKGIAGSTEKGASEGVTQNGDVVRESLAVGHLVEKNDGFANEPVAGTTVERYVPDEEVRTGRLNKGKEKEIYQDSEPARSVRETSPDPSLYRSKYVDRDITSFFVDSVNLSARPQTPPPPVPPVQARPNSPHASIQPFAIDFLPPFMLAKDIPEMSTAAQRVGAYQSRRQQMINTNTGLHSWLLEISQNRPLSTPQRKSVSDSVDK